MTGPQLPPEVRALINGPVASMAHVETLLLLRAAEPEPRALATIAAEAHIASPAAARRCLDDLVAAGLAVPVANDGYRFAPAPEARAGVDALAQAYNEKPVTLVRAIYSRPPAPVQSFADAFRLRGGEGQP